MLTSGRLPHSEYGGPLYVLGVVKTHDAEQQAISEKRRIEYLVASRYLQEAHAYGIPADREVHGLFLLGKSLVESSQFDEGIHTLDELLRGPLVGADPLALEAHRLLAATCLMMPHPQPAKALQHADAVLSNPQLDERARTDALLQRAECLTRLDRFDEAKQAIGAVPDGAYRRADIELSYGKIDLSEINAALQRVATQERKQVLDQSTAKAAEALGHLQQAIALDEPHSAVTRQASYHIGRAFEIQGAAERAIRQFADTRKAFVDTMEGLAAALAEADALRQASDFDEALLGYRRVLLSYTGAANYRSTVMPLEEVRERLITALKDFVERQRFADAIALTEHFSPLFTRAEQLEMRGDTLERWGNALVSQAKEDNAEAAKKRSAGYYRWRAAGLAFEQLADVRYDTEFYTNDLWRSADNYFRGRNFSRTTGLLQKYLENEPELRNAPALLRLGQAHLASGQLPDCINAFEECVEFHPLDSSTFQARSDCAKAYWSTGNATRAEQLLRDNLSGSSLQPTSREWKDSLFELGMLLHETGRYEEAIGELEIAIARYPQDPRRLMAQYVIGESYRRWAEEPLERARQARTESERTKNKQLADERLTIALENFAEVQRTITLKTHDIHNDPLLATMLRNCYMFEGAVLFNLGQYDPQRYKEAIEAYSNVASLYPDDPFVLETFVQIANCWRRLGQSDKARGSIAQAQIALDRLPTDADFTTATALNRDEWRMLLTNMRRW
jgi:tetratricopeptide (TPR) repeat protein